MAANSAQKAEAAEARVGKIADKARGHADDAKKTASAAASDLRDTASAARDDLAEQVSLLRMQLEDLASSVAEAGQQKASQAVREARRVGEESYEAVADYAGDAYAEAERFTADRPATALGMAAGMGLLVGLFLGRR
ncbi:MAG: DUF883 family protein [Pararhodobacter sp.]|nr:DUF883 family protein [Pararhodobacter sp.]